VGIGSRAGMAFRCIISAVIFLFVIVVPASASSVDRKDTVTIVVPADVFSVNPPESVSGTDGQIFGNIFQAPMIVDPKKGIWVNDLAESVEVINNKDVRVTLRKGPRFSTGDPVTAHDLKFSIEQFQDPKNAYIGAFIFDEVEEVEVIDEYTAIYRFWEPLSIFRGLLGAPVMSKKYYDKVGREVFRKNPVGSGPYRLAKRKKGEFLILERVENHFEYKPDFKALKFVIAPDPVTRMALLEAGTVDLIYDVLPHQVSRLKTHGDIIVKSNQTVPKTTSLSLGIHKDQKLRDPIFSQALNYAVNRDEICEKIFLGYAQPVYGYFAPGERGYDPGIRVDFDPEKARKLLRQSSYQPGTPLTMVYADQTGFHDMIAQVLQKYFADIGVTLVLQKMEPSLIVSLDRAKKHNQLGHVILTTFGGIDPYLKLVLFNKKSSPLYDDPGPAVYKDEPDRDLIDRLVFEQSREMDREKRLEILKQIGLAMKNQPGVALYTLSMIYAMNSRIDFTISEGMEVPTRLWRIKKAK